MIRTHFRDKAGKEVSRAEEQRTGGQVVQPWGESGGVDLQIQNTKYKIKIKNTKYKIQNTKYKIYFQTRLELADYEAENLARLQKMFSRLTLANLIIIEL